MASITDVREEGTGPTGNGALLPAVPWHRSLRTRLMLWTSLGGTALLLGASLLVYTAARQRLVEHAQTEIRIHADQAVRAVQAMLDSVAVSAATLAESVRGVGREPADLKALLRATVIGDPDIAGAMLILEPGALRDGDAGYHWYVRREPAGGFKEQPMLYSGYDYHAQPWWRQTVEAAQPWWSEPYRNDATGHVYFVTYNMPVRRADAGRNAPVVGMVSVDVPVTRLRGVIGAMDATSPIRQGLLSPQRLFVMHSDPEMESVMTLDEFARQSDSRVLTPFLEAAREHRYHEMIYRDPETGVRRMGLVQPIPGSGWTFALSASEAYLIEPLQRATRTVILGGLAAIAVMLVLLRLIARRITGPLAALTATASQFAAGEFERPLAATQRGDEVGVLARAFDRARTSIKSQLTEIEQLGAARQKLESELSIAREIQQAMLPPARALVSDGHRLEAHALLEPAKAVGGDFYSFFARDESTLWFVIGDVSDKGVPAALFMARTITVLEVAAGLGGSPEIALRDAARRLVEGNDACMFATVLCGVIDVRTGMLSLASAGHEPPALIHGDGRIELPTLAAGPPLGVEAAERYHVWRGRLRPGDALLAYTDGITEAFDRGNRPFGEERLRAALHPGRDARTLCEDLVAAVRRFADDAPQSDDITVLALSFGTQPAGGGME